MKCFGSSEQKHIFPACVGGGAEGYKRLDQSWSSIVLDQGHSQQNPILLAQCGVCAQCMDRIPETQLCPSILAQERSAGLLLSSSTLSDVAVSYW